MSNRPPPNALADLYDGLFTIRKEFSDQTDPLWRLAIESLLFGGDGLAPDMTPYGEQQAEQNSFTMTDYRDRYGNSDRVTEFPAIETASLTVATLSASAAPPDIQVPVTPETGTLVPIRVAAEDRPAALSCLQEFPATPDGKRLAAAPNAKVLAPEAFPELGDSSGSDEQQRSQFSNSATSASTDTTSDTTLEPNELAELYDGCRRLLELIPDQSPATAVWQTALEALLYDTDFLRGGICGYGEQQAQRNRFGMATYREAYGDGEAVTQFAAVDSAPPTQADNIPLPDNLTLPVAPESQTGLPVTPTEETLADALVLLQEFPATPAADERGGNRADLKMKLDYEALLLAHGFDLDEFTDVLSGSNPGAGSPPAASSNNSIEADADGDILRAVNGAASHAWGIPANYGYCW